MKMKSVGSCRLAWQQGNVALFADVTIRVDRVDNDKFSLGEVDGIADAWRDGIRFGFTLVQEALSSVVGLSGVSISIQDFIGQPCDTTSTAVAYATFHAIVDAIGAPITNVFSFDKSTGRFCIAIA